MKVIRQIPSIFACAILILAIWAAWDAFKAIQVPKQPVAQNEFAEFESRLSEETDILIDRRENAVHEMELRSGITSELPALYSQSGTDAAGSFERAGNIAESTLSWRIGNTGYPSITEGFPASEILGETLDEADRLNGEWLDIRTGNGIRICMDSLIEASGRSIRKSGYRRLIETLNRDLIKYRSLDSLQIHGEKLTLYQTELDNIRNSDLSSHAEVRNLVSESNSSVDAQYDSLVDGLFNNFVEIWTGDEMAESGPIDESRVLEDLRARVNGFSPVILTVGSITELPNAPDLSRMEWLAVETDSTNEFEEQAGRN
ncbi:MAG: hypothetical protein NTY09_07955 [bacterium]|nr:hypothetical protein [bacterium]